MSAAADRRAERRRAQRGFALVAVLWAGMLIGVIAAGFAFAARVETRLAAVAVERARAEALADGGIRLGIYALLASGAGPGWQADGQAHEVEIGNARVRVALAPTTARIDINRAPDELVRAAVRAAAAGLDVNPEAAADGILDWRDRDHRSRPAGAEDDDYAARGLPYGARDAPFADVAEVAEVLGVGRELAPRLARLLTVHSGRPSVDAASAPAAVLRTLPDLDPALAEEFIAERERRRAEGLEAPLEMIRGQSRYLSSSRTMTFEVQAEAVTAGAARVLRRAVVRPLTRRQGKPWLIVDWRDIESAPASGDNGVRGTDAAADSQPVRALQPAARVEERAN